MAMNEQLKPTCVDAVEKIAAAQPGHTAVIDSGVTWSYGELVDRIRAWAGRLADAGMQPGQRIALVAESSAHYLAAALGVWRAGGVLVTVYPSSSRSDLEYAITSSDPALLIVDDDFDQDLLGSLRGRIPTALLGAADVPPVRHDAAPNPEGLREPLHLICFSSGTTSRPKAIMLSATAVLNCAQTYAEVWRLSAEDRGIVCLPMAWMYGLASTSLALLHAGATVIVVRRARPEPIAAAAAEHRATFLAGVSNTFAKLVQHADHQQLDLSGFATLRLCISGGEPRNEPAFERWLELTGTAVLDAYCASECLPLVTYDPVENQIPRLGSAGKVVPRSQLRVVDPGGHDVAVGDVGEALSTGPGLMLGYWQDPEETRAALTEDGWYRTKDLVRVDEDGFVYVVGRLSDLIIRAGVNISPAEVERVLRTHPDVADVAVVGLADDLYGQQVAAAVVPRQQGVFDSEALAAFARDHLTSYKVPSTFVRVDPLPLNTNGKVSRRDVAQELAATVVPGSRATGESR